jgi:DNA-binding CsgD family transcriptional regulator
MAERWSLLVLVVAVSAGLITVTVAAVLVRTRQTALFRYLLVQVLLFNLLILSGLVAQYLQLQSREAGAALPAAVLSGFIGATAILKLAWLYAFSAMTLVLPGQDLPGGFSRRFLSSAALFAGTWMILLALGALTRFAGAILTVLTVSMEVVVVGGAIVACGRLLARARELPDEPRRRSVALLGGAYFAIFVVMLGSLAAGWIRATQETGRQVLFNSAVMVVYNVLPLAWLLRFRPLSQTAARSATERYGISAREREIIDLILAGHTNQEIADRLFISLATVKDHNYNIFRKTGVRNRVELVNLMRDTTDGNERYSGTTS